MCVFILLHTYYIKLIRLVFFRQLRKFILKGNSFSSNPSARRKHIHIALLIYSWQEGRNFQFNFSFAASSRSALASVDTTLSSPTVSTTVETFLNADGAMLSFEDVFSQFNVMSFQHHSFTSHENKLTIII